MESLISVIVPVYNVKSFLELCINSIVGQTYDNLEIIIVDDGSTDGSATLCDNLERLDDRIVVFHKKNGGLSDARNFGIERAKGDFFAFIDSDDVLHKDFFTELIKSQRETDADIVACDISLFYDHNELKELHRLKHSTRQIEYSTDEALKEYFMPVESRKLYHGLCMKIYKRNLFEDLRFEKGRLHEDVYITYRLLDRAQCVVYVDCPYYFYYKNNQGSICKNYGVNNFLDEAEAYDGMYRYFAEKNRVTKELITFLLIQYVNMFETGYRERHNDKVKECTLKIKEWINQHYKECAMLNVKNRVMINLTMFNMMLAHFLRSIIGRLFHG